MNASKEKVPCTAATMQGRDNNVQEQYNTTSQERQEAFRLATALESLATDIEQAQQLVGLLAENLDEEGQKRNEARADQNLHRLSVGAV